MLRMILRPVSNKILRKIKDDLHDEGIECLRKFWCLCKEITTRKIQAALTHKRYHPRLRVFVTKDT